MTDRKTKPNSSQGLTTMPLDEFARNIKANMLAVSEGDYLRIPLQDGAAAVIIDEAEWKMLVQALKIRLEHPEWADNNGPVS